jgi:multidrug efflux pump subunit AcrA (membrane-fusion protein)
MTAMLPRTLSTIAGLALIGIGLPACSRETTVPAEATDAIAVTVATVGMADVAGTFEAGGVVEARTTATLMARIVAPVGDVQVSTGDRVRAGQVLIVLDARDLAAHARRARAAAASADQDVIAADSERQAAEAALALARATHARIAGLHAKRSATAQELDDVTGALHAAEARAAGAAARARSAAAGVEAARAASDVADTTESFSQITAPFDGVVTEKIAEPGNMATPGTPLMRVEDVRGLRRYTGLSRQDLTARRERAALRDVRQGAFQHPATARPDGPSRRPCPSRPDDLGLRRREGRRAGAAGERQRHRSARWLVGR